MKVTIITVCYNSEVYIENCIKSVLGQTYKNIEFIIVDGLSTDGTLKKIKKYSENISRILSEPDQGIYDAMNKGIKISKGEIIGFLHSDDLYANQNIISKVVEIFKDDASIDACYADLIYVSRSDITKVIRYWKSNKFEKGSFSKGWSPPHPTFFVRSSVYKRFGTFNLKYPVISDIELMMRFLELYKIKSKYINEIWVKMRLGGISNKNIKNIIKQNRDVLYALDENGLDNNIYTFCINKIISRLKQFVQKPKM